MKIKIKIVETWTRGIPVVELICMDKGDFPTTLIFDRTGTRVDLADGKRDRSIPLILGDAIDLFEDLKKKIKLWRDWQKFPLEKDIDI